jgi:hypothetical protein
MKGKAMSSEPKSTNEQQRFAPNDLIKVFRKQQWQLLLVLFDLFRWRVIATRQVESQVRKTDAKLKWRKNTSNTTDKTKPKSYPGLYHGTSLSS